MQEVKKFIWGLVVVVLVSCVFWLRFDLAALDENLLFSDSSRDLLIANHLLSLQDTWLLAPANSSNFLPSIPLYYWLVAGFYLLAGLQIKWFFVLYMVWLSFCALFLFLSLNKEVNTGKALLLTSLFVALFASGELPISLFQPTFALPFVFLFLRDVTAHLQQSTTKLNLFFAILLGLFAAMLHYSNLVLLLVIPVLLYVTHQKKFSSQQLFFLTLGLFGMLLAGAAVFDWELLQQNLKLLVWTGDLYFNFQGLIFFLIALSLFFLYRATFIQKQIQAGRYFLLSSFFLWITLCIPFGLYLIGIEPRMYYVVSSLLTSIFFLLHGLAVLFADVKISLFWERFLFYSTVVAIALSFYLSTTLVKAEDIKRTNAFAIAEYMAQRYFSNRIPFQIGVSQTCGDTADGAWFSGGIWLFFEKITGEKVICLNTTGQNFNECFYRQTSQIYHVCKNESPDFKVPSTMELVFRTPQGWKVYLLP